MREELADLLRLLPGRTPDTKRLGNLLMEYRATAEDGFEHDLELSCLGHPFQRAALLRGVNALAAEPGIADQALLNLVQDRVLGQAYLSVDKALTEVMDHIGKGDLGAAASALKRAHHSLVHDCEIVLAGTRHSAGPAWRMVLRVLARQMDAHRMDAKQMPNLLAALDPPTFRLVRQNIPPEWKAKHQRWACELEKGLGKPRHLVDLPGNCAKALIRRNQNFRRPADIDRAAEQARRDTIGTVPIVPDTIDSSGTVATWRESVLHLTRESKAQADAIGRLTAHGAWPLLCQSLGERMSLRGAPFPPRDMTQSSDLSYDETDGSVHVRMNFYGERQASDALLAYFPHRERWLVTCDFIVDKDGNIKLDGHATPTIEVAELLAEEHGRRRPRDIPA